MTSAVARIAGLAGAPELGDGLRRGEVQQVERPRLVAGEREVAPDHDALGHGRVAAEAELGRDEALVHVAAARERRLFAVNGHRPPCRGAVLERAPDHPWRDDRAAIVAEPRGAALGQLDHLGQLGARLGLRDRCEEPDRDLRLAPGRLGERAEHGCRVDDRIGVGHGQNGAVAARCRGARPGGEILLVLAPGCAQVHVRVDERRREHLAVRRRRCGLDGCDHAILDGDRQRVVEAARRVDDADVFERERVLAAVLAEEDHHATSSISATLISTGPCVSRS